MTRSITVLAAVVGLAVACSPASIAPPAASSDAGPASDAEGPQAIAAACKDYAHARCLRVQACSPTSMQFDYGDQRTCEIYQATVCVNALQARGTGRTVDGYRACTAAVLDPRQWLCNDVIYSKNLPPACAQVLGGGALADGSPCAVHAQCQSAYCSIPPGAACGICGAPAKIGGACPCSSDQVCSSGICSAVSELGAACDKQHFCDADLTCVGGTCAAGAAAAGAPCSFTGAGCDTRTGLSCNAESGTCKTLVLAGPGEACGTVENQPQRCIAGKCERGVCVGYAPLGGACDIVAGPSCGSSLVHCVVTSDGGTEGTCQLVGTTACP